MFSLSEDVAGLVEEMGFNPALNNIVNDYCLIDVER